MHIAICEDEEIFSSTLIDEIKQILDAQQIEAKIDVFHEGKDFLAKFLEENSYDLIFMDIQLQDSDGVDIMAQIRNQNKSIPVIFITSLEHRALDGYDVNAFGFLVKKNFKEKLPLVLNRWIEENFTSNTIPIIGHANTTFLTVQQILWVESDKRNTLIHTPSEAMTALESIQHFSSKLPTWAFVESFKSVYVNVDHIIKINADTLELDSGNVLPVSRRNRKNVMFAVMQRLSKR